MALAVKSPAAAATVGAKVIAADELAPASKALAADGTLLAMPSAPTDMPLTDEPVVAAEIWRRAPPPRRHRGVNPRPGGTCGNLGGGRCQFSGPVKNTHGRAAGRTGGDCGGGRGDVHHKHLRRFHQDATSEKTWAPEERAPVDSVASRDIRPAEAAAVGETDAVGPTAAAVDTVPTTADIPVAIKTKGGQRKDFGFVVDTPRCSSGARGRGGLTGCGSDRYLPRRHQVDRH